VPPVAAPLRFRATELDARLLDPGWLDQTEAHCVVLDLTEPGNSRYQADLAPHLGEVPLPVVGCGTAVGGTLAQAVDVLVKGDDDLAAVLAGIDANPQASAVLVQVLRSVGKLPIDGALALESLAYATLQGGPEFAGWLAARGPAAAKPAPPDDVVRLERSGTRLTIVLNAPHNRNALSAPMRDALTQAFQMVQLDADIGAVDVLGNGPCFSAGGDLTEFGSVADPATAHAIRMRRMPARFLAARAEHYHFHLHGACVGAGIELPAFAGRITATADAYFQLPEVAMGLIPGAGGCVSIPRRIGRQRTALMALTGQRVDAQQALSWGLVDAVAP
jgi:enoyl-CoA hydratase